MIFTNHKEGDPYSIRKIYYRIGVQNDWYKIEAKRFIFAIRYIKRITECVDGAPLDKKDLFEIYLSFGWLIQFKIYK